jgi:hypothetical protein
MVPNKPSVRRELLGVSWKIKKSFCSAAVLGISGGSEDDLQESDCYQLHAHIIPDLVVGSKGWNFLIRFIRQATSSIVCMGTSNPTKYLKS